MADIAAMKEEIQGLIQFQRKLLTYQKRVFRGFAWFFGFVVAVATPVVAGLILQKLS